MSTNDCYLFDAMLQVGYAYRIVWMTLDGGAPVTMINPKITWRSEEMFQLWGGCHSYVDLLSCVSRHVSVSISFLDEQGIPHQWLNTTRDVSELLEHEMDHLEGILGLNVSQGTAVTPNGKACGTVQHASHNDETVSSSNAAHTQEIPLIIRREEVIKNRVRFESLASLMQVT
jgi:hypothetical protein